MSRHAYGLRAWLVQRISAIYVALYLLYFIYFLLTSMPVNYSSWHEWMKCPLTSLLTAVFFVSLLIHAWVGFRDIIMDYVHPLGIRLTVLSVFAFGLIACGFWVLKILISV